MNAKVDEPLVSVGVISYNSSDYILDVLESIKAQTYPNIELIISDDKSPDNTVEICKEWISKNKERFVRVEIIVPERNTGTAGNYNRALFASTGEWMKFIDADDLLLPNCLEDDVQFVRNNPEAKVVFSDILYFSNPYKLSDKHFVSKEEKEFFKKNAHEQLMVVLKKNHIPPSSSFIKMDVLKANPYKEEYILMEDTPKWIDLLNKGYKFYYFDKVTTGYRICNSVTRNKVHYYSPLFVECIYKFLWMEQMNLIKKYKNQEAYNYQLKQMLKIELTFGLLNNKRSFLHDILFFCLRVFVKFCTKFKIP